MDLKNYQDFTQEAPYVFAKHSSIGCGGWAKVAFYPKRVEEAVDLIQRLKKEGVSYYVLGNLTNVLPADGACSRVVVSTKRLQGITLGERIFALAGVTSGELLACARRENREGAEFLKGIPCTLGGALYMNAGVRGGYMSDIVEAVLVLRDGKLLRVPLSDCGFAYKKSVFMQNDDVILGVWLRLKKGKAEDISAKEQAYLERRKHLPTGRSMGCVFKNPTEGTAGALIEGSGLKGLRFGGARISEEHANFIINEGNATAGDIRALVSIAKNAVRAQYGITLEEEIRYL